MDISALKEIFSVGETIAVEFKRCGNRIENDTYETVCSFLNRFGGDIFLYSGSHGCVNLPLEAAETLYSYAYNGMPVICYYR